MRALITRPEEDAAPLAQALSDKGVDVTVEPLLTIHPITDAPIDLDGVQALIFTSANGVRAFAALSERRDIGVLAVGNGTAAAARAAGFQNVESAGGDVHDLARLVKERLDPKNGALFHAAGSVVAGDLAGQLGQAGYELRRAVLYEAKPAEALSESVVRALADRDFDLVLFFSPRTATTFVELVRKTGDPRLLAGCAEATALCLSPAVAAAAGAISWKEVRSAAKPDLESMLRLVDEAVAAHTPEPAPARDTDVLSPPPLSPIAAAPRGNLAAVLAAALTAAAVALAVIMTEPFWRPHLAGILPAEPAATDPTVAVRLDALEEQSADVARRLAAIDGAINQLDARGSGAASDLSQLAQRLEALEHRSAQLEQALADVEARPVPTAPADATIPDEIRRLPDRIAAMERRMDGLASAAAAAAELPPELAQELDSLRRQVEVLQTTANSFQAWIDTVDSRLKTAEALEPRIAALEQAASNAAQRAVGNAALALAVTQLQAAVTAARSYEAELTALNDLAAGDAALAAEIGKAREALAPRAATGIPTLAALRAAFPETARAAVAGARAERAAAAVAGETSDRQQDAPGWLDQVMLRLSELVSVRPVGEDVQGDDAAARVARAEAALGKGDLAGAVAEVEALEGKAREAASGWLADARARLDADAALAALQAAMVARLKPVDGGG